MNQGARWLVLAVTGSAMLLTFCGGKSEDGESGGSAARTGGSGGNGHAGSGGSTGGAGLAGFGGSGNAGVGHGGTGGCRSDTCPCQPGMCHIVGSPGPWCVACGGAGNGGAGAGGVGGCNTDTCPCLPGTCRIPGSVLCGACAGSGGAGVGGVGGCNTDTCSCLPGTCRNGSSGQCYSSDTCPCAPGRCGPPSCSNVCPAGGAGNGGAGVGGGCTGDTCTCGPGVCGGPCGPCPEAGAANDDGGAPASPNIIPPSRKTALLSPSMRACYAANASEGDPCLPPDGAIVGWLSDLPPGCDAQVKGGPFSATDERGLLCCYSVECLGERSVPMAR